MLAVSILSLIVAVGAAFFAWKSSAAASRSADASEASAATAKTQADISKAEFDAKEPSLVAIWASHWKITNEGGGPAFNVNFYCEPGKAKSNFTAGSRLDVGDSFIVLPPFMAPGGMLRVDWTRIPRSEGPAPEWITLTKSIPES